MTKKIYSVEGMHCPSCEIYIESQFNDIDGVKNVKSNSKTQKLTIEADDNIEMDKVIDNINKDIKKNGYNITTELNEKESNIKTYIYAFLISVLFMFFFFILERYVIGNAVFTDKISYPTIFLIGIIASISSCMAVVGTLVLSMSSVYAKSSSSTKPMVYFHISRILSFFILGGILGAVGSLFTISSGVEIAIGVLLFFVMLILGLNLLDISPRFRKFEITLPKGISTRLIKNTGNSIFTPFLLGMITFFLPCGFTQAMQLNAVVSASFIGGALTMLVFSLGTLPVLSLITIGSKKIVNGKYSDLFLKSSGFLVIFFSIFNLVGSLIANGVISPIF